MNSSSAAIMASRRSRYIPRNSPIWALQSKESRYMAMEYWPTEDGHRIAASDASFIFSRTAGGATAQPTR